MGNSTMYTIVVGLLDNAQKWMAIADCLKRWFIDNDRIAKEET